MVTALVHGRYRTQFEHVLPGTQTVDTCEQGLRLTITTPVVSRRWKITNADSG